MPSPFRRWPRVRFRLWHLLALVTLLCGWLGYEKQRANRIIEATRTLRAAQCMVTNTRRFGTKEQINDQDLFVLPVSTKDASKTTTVTTFAQIRRRIASPIPAPRWLVELVGETVFIEPYEAVFEDSIRETDRIEVVNALRDLKTLRRVKQLTGVTDQELEIISSSSRLEFLELQGPLTDASVPNLGKLRALKYLQLLETKLTQDGFDELRKLLPTCSMSFRE
jgi:hypothetical protein